jgi:hypothetical protein
VLFATSLGMALRAYQGAGQRSFPRGFSAGTCGALLIVAIYGFLDASLWAARSSPLLWVLLSLGPVARNLAATA